MKDPGTMEHILWPQNRDGTHSNDGQTNAKTWFLIDVHQAEGVVGTQFKDIQKYMCHGQNLSFAGHGIPPSLHTSLQWVLQMDITNPCIYINIYIYIYIYKCTYPYKPIDDHPPIYERIVHLLTMPDLKNTFEKHQVLTLEDILQKDIARGQHPENPQRLTRLADMCTGAKRCFGSSVSLGL